MPTVNFKYAWLSVHNLDNQDQMILAIDAQGNLNNYGSLIDDRFPEQDFTPDYLVRLELHFSVGDEVKVVPFELRLRGKKAVRIFLDRVVPLNPVEVVCEDDTQDDTQDDSSDRFVA